MSRIEQLEIEVADLKAELEASRGRDIIASEFVVAATGTTVRQKKALDYAMKEISALHNSTKDSVTHAGLVRVYCAIEDILEGKSGNVSRETSEDGS